VSFNERIIDEFRSNGGVTDMFGSSLVLLHTVGARSGEPRVHPVMSIRDGESWLVIASAAGNPKSPAWYFNIVAQPAISIETPDGMVDVLGTELDGAEWDAAWQGFTSRSAAFEQYVQRAEGRQFPILRLSRR
jgi:deazaflavin-dependent oxidoreductase (nitroreductase family)